MVKFFLRNNIHIEQRFKLRDFFGGLSRTFSPNLNALVKMIEQMSGLFHAITLIAIFIPNNMGYQKRGRVQGQ